MAPIGIAVIGSGIFVKESHLPAIEANSTLLSLKAIYSRSLSSATALHGSLSTTFSKSDITIYAENAGPGKSYSDLLARSDISGVIIALPIPAQPEFIKQALLAGKHVLSEKPVAKDLAAAQELIKWYHDQIDVSKVTWGVAENFRFLSRFRYGADQVQQLGRVLGFQVKVHLFVKPGTKYYETSWRKDAKMTRVSAYTAQLQEHLPPIDTVDATVRLANGATGTFSVSFGTTFTGVAYVVACEQGTVDVGFDKTTVKRGDDEVSESFPEDKNGVRQEVKAWVKSIAQGKQDPLQSP
ncbi:hypothetical protein BDV97DRAFT_371993 [Delphinella strobiligena]|nr:hypothetical protein BDV97DRAFT_371993 [Delphinella strobiligena]